MATRSQASWGEILSDSTVRAAVLDRLLHRSVVLAIRVAAAGHAPTRCPPEKRRPGETR